MDSRGRSAQPEKGGGHRSERAQRAAERERRERLLEESKKIVLVEDPALPAAKKVRRCCAGLPSRWGTHRSQAKIGHLEPLRGQRVKVSGWVHRLRSQKDIIFIVLREGTGYLQCVLSGKVVRDIGF